MFILGFNPDLRIPNETARTAYLFQEMWKFNIMTQKWSKTFTPNVDASRMPEELASNAVVMKDGMMVVRNLNLHNMQMQIANSFGRVGIIWGIQLLAGNSKLVVDVIDVNNGGYRL